MSNLPVPTPQQVSPGSFNTASLWNANVYNGLTYLLNPPIFFGHQATTQSFTASGTNYSVTLDSGDIDTYNGHSNTTNPSRYTAQVAGYYMMSGCVTYAANATGDRSAKIYVNGSAIVGGSTEDATVSSSESVAVASPMVIKYLNVGDYVEITGRQTSGGTLATVVYTDQACSLAVVWIHA